MIHKFSREDNFPLTKLAELVEFSRNQALMRFHDILPLVLAAPGDSEIRIIKVPNHIKIWRRIGYEVTYREELLNYISTFDEEGRSVLASYIYYYYSDPELKNLFRRQFYREDTSLKVMFDD